MRFSRFFSGRFLAVMGLMLVLAALLTVSVVGAQESEAQSYIVQAGGATLGNADALLFAPGNVQIHRGDTVLWQVNGFHNIRFGEAAPLVIVGEVDGQPMPQMNPLAFFPSIENGGTFTGGEAGSGVPEGAPMPTFTLTFDVDPGAYTYFCDVHPGMTGTVTVVEDGTAVPSPAEAAAMGAQELNTALSSVGANFATTYVPAPAMGEGNAVSVSAGVILTSTDYGNVEAQWFAPQLAVVQTGGSVTWTVPEGSSEIHTVTWSPDPGAPFAPIEQEGGPPIIALGPGLMPGPNPIEVGGADATYNSGALNPGQPFTITFTEPGVYPYLCILHPGMNGVVVVQDGGM